MKNTFKFAALTIALISFICFGFTGDNKKPEKITICHVPPGNPDNCHEITISVNALDAHFGHHDDALVCPSPDLLVFYNDLSAVSGMRLRTAFSVDGQ